MGITRNELYDRIHLQPEIIEKLDALSEQIDISGLTGDLERMMDRKTARPAYLQLKELLSEDEEHLKMLYCQLECARRLHDRYREMQIPETVFTETMRCFARFIEECRVRTGRMFFDRGWWTYRQVSMSLFRIGALEYEMKEYEGENVIAIHIPSDADLSRESVDVSLGRAEQFFRTCYADYEYGKYTCGSWLLSPALRASLAQDSNILAFQDRFTVIEEDSEDREFIEWLFQVSKDTDYRKLPERTSLQRNIKERLIRGETVCSAFGIIFNSEESNGEA